MIILLMKSPNKNKKYRVIINNKKIDFGASGYEDMIIHNNLYRKYLYLMRHYKNENWENIMTAGFWSRWLLWNLNTLEESIKDTEKRFNIKIINLV
jgi:thiamine kinase-like enzyme